MGLGSLSINVQANDYLYYGLGLYGAFTGERGGFFVAGANLGIQYPIFSNLYLDMGAFAGGGGGGSAPQGGGMMLKSYIGGLYKFKNYSLGLNYSNITFPNGDIQSNQISLMADMKFDTSFANTPVDIDSLKKYNFVNNKDYIISTFQLYYPKKGTLKTDGTPLNKTVELIGIEYGRNLSKHTIAYVESAGAMGGDSTGYMEVLGGLGYTKDITASSNLQAKLSLGAAGGGMIKTNGGSISKTSLNFNYNPTKYLYTGVALGYYHAFEGDFDAKTAKVNLGINTNFLSLTKSKNSFDYDSISTQKFNLRVTNQTYLSSDTLRASNDNTPVQLLGFKVDYFTSENFYISGQALWAYIGKAGGYAVGFLGLGYIQPIVGDISLVTELDFGASGGGSIESGDGNIVQPMIGLNYDLSESISCQAMYGRVMATDGPLDANVFDFGFVYRFDKLVGK